MATLEDYRQCISAIESIKREQSDESAQSHKTQEKVALKKQELESFKTRMQMSVQSFAHQHLQGLLNECNTKYFSRETEIANKLTELSNNYCQLQKQIAADPYQDQLFVLYQLEADITKLLHDKGFENTYSDAVSTAISKNLEVTGNSVNPTEIRNLMQQVIKLSDDLPVAKDSDIASACAKALTLDISVLKKAKWVTPTIRFIFYLGYVALLIALFICYPAVPICIYSVSMLILTISSYHKHKSRLRYMRPFLCLKKEYLRLCEEISLRLSLLRNDATSKAYTEYLTDFNKLSDELTSVKAEHQQEFERIKQTTSLDTLTSAGEAQYASQIEMLEKDILTLEKTASRLKKFMASNTVRLTHLTTKCDQLKEQVIKSYLCPTKPGTSRLLSKSFLLGLNDSGEFIEFNYEGSSTIIIYKGETNQVNTPLVSMILMQLLSSMSILSLHFYIVDLSRGGSDYAVFSPKELQNRIVICNSTQQLTALLENLHELFVERQTLILTESTGIEQYNQAMLSRKSLPQDYHFLLLQDPPSSLIASENLLQLCRVGPTIGIIPILFISHSDMNDLLQDENSTIALNQLVATLPGKIFIFDGTTQDLSYTEDSVQKLIKKTMKGQT